MQSRSELGKRSAWNLIKRWFILPELFQANWSQADSISWHQIKHHFVTMWCVISAHLLNPLLPFLLLFIPFLSDSFLLFSLLCLPAVCPPVSSTCSGAVCSVQRGSMWLCSRAWRRHTSLCWSSQTLQPLSGAKANPCSPTGPAWAPSTRRTFSLPWRALLYRACCSRTASANT